MTFRLFCRRCEVIQEVEEERDSCRSTTPSRPRSKTKREKDQENKKMKNFKKDKSSSLKSSSDVEEKEILTDTDNSSSNWVTQSQVTVSDSSENGEKRAETQEKFNNDEGSTADIKSLTDTYTVVSESDDNHVVVVSKQANETYQEDKYLEQNLDEIPTKDTDKIESEPKTERSRGNIPISTGSKPYLRSHSGSWKTHRRRRQSKTDKISASLPADQPFQANLSQSTPRDQLKGLDSGGSKHVEFPKLNEEKGNNHPTRDTASASPPLPPVSSSTASISPPRPSTGTGRISRSIENVISKLDRRSMSVLPQIGKSDSEGELLFYTTLHDNIFHFVIRPSGS